MFIRYFLHKYDSLFLKKKTLKHQKIDFYLELVLVRFIIHFYETKIAVFVVLYEIFKFFLEQ